MKKVLSLLLALLASFSLISCSSIGLEFEDIVDGVIDETIDFIDREEDIEGMVSDFKAENIDEKEYYTSKEDVALYIHVYDKLPSNFISKKEASKLGWESSKGNLWDVADQMSIGGDRFGNREKLLPSKEGRQYYECDIDYDGEYRGAKRIVYSDDGLIYYTGDHYKSFSLLYGDENK